jgi:hypothetical protein
LNKKSAQKQKDQETTASRKPLFHQKGLDNKNVLKPKTSKPLKEPPHKWRFFFNNWPRVLLPI